MSSDAEALRAKQKKKEEEKAAAGGGGKMTTSLALATLHRHRQHHDFSIHSPFGTAGEIARG